jgi:hypothetical protein
MGAPAQQQPVYYDTDKSQYYTNGSLSGNNLLVQMLGRQMGIPERNYLGNPYGSNSFADRFTPKNIPAQYPEMNMLFPALNTGLLQGITSSIQPDGAMSGAGRFLSPQTTNTQGK